MPVWAYQTAAAYLVVISIVGLVMNILVVIAIVSDRQMTPLNWMLLNLACSDGLIAAFGSPVSAFAALQHGWPFSDELCIAYAMIMSSAGIGSITTLTALALWRCQLVVYCPAKRSSAFANNNNGGRMGHCQAVLLLAIIWTYSLAVTCPPLFGWGRYDREAAHISCSVNWESKMDNNRLYIVYMFAFGLFVPLAVIVISYVSILRVVKKAGKFKKTMSTMPHNVDQSHEISDQQPSLLKKTEQHKKQTSDAAEKRVTVMVACMVGAFMTAWTPYSILALFETFAGQIGIPSNSNSTSQENEFQYVGTISPGFATVPSLFAKTSAVLNPLIYGLLNTQFRTAWEKFCVRFLNRRQLRKNKELRDLFSCVGHDTPTLKPSTSVHFSLREMVSNESQSAYVMARHVVASSPVVRFVRQQQQHKPTLRVKFLSPSLASSSSTAEADTSAAHQQSIQTRGFKNPSLQHQPEEEVRNEPGKLVVILSITESTSCTTTTDDHAFTATLEEESVFTEQTPENVSDSLDINISPIEH
ncbi:rhodopsin-like isoform X2 [Daphnia carinata]|uniref:rhodopsin-like isoform X2 n=1 Tax=Daphnia carinata TaxID=120202 RepID=UPI002868BE2C|nr:rhodopsin-like isoform X2 [Daphnia carinata]